MQRQSLGLALGVSDSSSSEENSPVQRLLQLRGKEREGLCVFSNYISRAPHREISDVKQQDSFQGYPEKSSVHREAK